MYSHGSGIHAREFGADGQSGSYSDVDYTDCIFMVGHNVSATQTVLWTRIMDRLEGSNPPKLIVVDPRRTQTAKKATVHLAPKVGSNVALLNGIQHLLFKNGWVNHDWVSKHAIGVAELKEKVDHYTPQYVEEVTEVPAAKLQQAAETIGNTGSLLSKLCKAFTSRIRPRQLRVRSTISTFSSVT